MQNPFTHRKINETSPSNFQATHFNARCKTFANKALSVALSITLVLTMNPVASTSAFAVEKYNNGNIAGGGLLVN